jgi:hypothetical protein
LISSGKVAANPENEPKVMMYRLVIVQVCLLPKMSNCCRMLARTGTDFSQTQAVAANTRMNGT